MDTFKFNGLPPEQAPKEMNLPPGFVATLFAGEPDVMQPIAMAIDDRGRLWIAEAYTYPIRAAEGEGKDRILVFEDTNGDGKFDKRTVFMEHLNLVSGLEVGFGGVWIGAAPYLMFVPVKGGTTPQPAGPPQIILDGWAYQDTHETLNTFTWGPDGWLYGCQGVFTHSNVGRPGAPQSERTPVNAAVWRYHPTRQVFEIFAEGTSNPWGIDFDEHGQCIIEACVIPHLFHMIQGGRYQRQAGSHFNPNIYDDIKTIADHVHWVGNKGPHAGNARSASAGGGHAHAGLLVYQEDNWPEQFAGKVYMNNIHGACINTDVIEPRGSGFVGHHAPNLINFNDSWSQIINLESGPDGGVYMIDWYDKNQCHHNDPNGHDRSNGRIFKITYSGAPQLAGLFPADLAHATDEELLQLQIQSWNPNAKDNWWARHARRLIRERAAAHKLTLDFPKRAAELRAASKLNENQDLRLLWATHAAAGTSEASAAGLLKSDHQYVRAWTVQLLCEENKPSASLLNEFARMAREDTSPIVRLYLASALQRIPPADRWPVLEALFAHSEDAKDHNLPLLEWYAAEPMPTVNPQKALALAESTKLPQMLEFTARRCVVAGTAAALAAITDTLMRVSDRDNLTLDMLNGIGAALENRRTAPMPAGWDKVEAKLGGSPNAEVRARAQTLSLKFGSATALAALKQTLMDGSASANSRRMAGEALLAAKEPSLAPMLQQLLRDSNLRGLALRGLAAYDHQATPQAILNTYSSFNDATKRDALNTLASRVIYAKPLLDSVSEGKVPKKDLTAELVRQLRSLKDADLDQLIVKVWGVMRDSAADKQQDMEKYRHIYEAGGSKPGDASRGRGVFARICQQCHTLFDTGGKVGPDLTGSNRGDLDYLLQNIVDPNAVIPNDYKAWNLETTDDRSITGIMKQQDDKAVTLVTANETLVIPRNEIKSLKESELSMMPEGLLQPLADQEVRDLLYYLRSPAQALMPVGADMTSAFFNGKDLAGWEGDMNLWKVENGEIVGRTASGIKHNEFLKNKMDLDDFRLVVKIKLVPDGANSGIQFRSEKFGEYEMKGPQADVGAGWWGKLYEENGRAVLSDKSGEPFLNKEDWNTYEVLAVGAKIRTAINGHVCVDLDDPKISRHGMIGLQMHSGGPTDVRFKDFQLEINPKFELITVKESAK
jgi:putative membrane-bound dehydrogenase-like protein